MRFRTAIIWNGISQFGQSGITLLSTILLARLLTPDDFGIIGIVTIFIAFSQMLVDSEMGGALLKKKEVTLTDYSTLFYYNLAVSLVLYGIIYLTAPYIADFYSRPCLVEVIRVISLCIVIHAFRVVQKIMLFRSLDFRTYAVITVVSGIISLLVAIWMAYNHYQYWALVWQQIVLATTNVILMGIHNRFIPILRFSKESFRYQFSFGIGLMGSNIVVTIANNISANIIAKISSLGFTGYYTQTSRITNFCQNTISSLMDQSIFPILAKLNKLDELRHYYHRLARWIILICGGVTVLFVVFGHWIIRIVLSEEWIAATWMFRILSIAILPASLQVLCRNIIKVTGNTRQIMYIETLKAIIVIIFLFAATFLGDLYVVWAIPAAQIIGCLIWIMKIQRLFKHTC